MSVVGIGIATFEELGEILLKQLTGKDKDAHPDLEERLKGIAKDAFEAGAKQAEALVRAVVEEFGLGLAIRDLADQVAAVPKAFDVSDSPLPNLLEGADVQMVPIEDWDDVKTPDGSSGR